MSRNARPESAAPWSRFALGALPWVAPLALLEAFVWSIREAASWPIVHDVPLMVYAGFLMQEHGLVPYRDFFEMNPPGTLSFNAAYYELFGASPAAFRVAHLSWLAAVLAGIVAPAFVARAQWLLRLGRRPVAPAPWPGPQFPSPGGVEG